MLCSFPLQSRYSVNTWLACYKFFHGRSNWQASFTMIQVMSAFTIQTLKQAPLQPKVNTQLCIAKHHFHRHLYAEGLPMWWTVLPSISFGSNVPNINFHTPRSKRKTTNIFMSPGSLRTLLMLINAWWNVWSCNTSLRALDQSSASCVSDVNLGIEKKRVQKPLTSQVSPRFKKIYIYIYA